MNKKLKTSLIMAGLLSSLSNASFAAGPDTPTINAPEKITAGNGFEREMTPLLREISRKKSQLELRKLDRELEKMDEESLKAQMNMENTMNGGGNNKAPGGYDPFANSKSIPSPSAAPNGMPAGGAMPASLGNGAGTAANPIEGASDIKVLMIYGFDDKLYAKIASGDQGGYAVKKGDVLPNGQVVHNVTANYIEVKKNAGTNKGPIQRIFVSQSVPSTTSDGGTAKFTGGSSGSTSMRPNLPPQAQSNNDAAAALLAPVASPGAVRR
jgi:hypothetical protein